MSRFGVFKINGVEYDLDALTLDELEVFEEIAGGPMDTVNWSSAKTLKAVATIFLRRSNPAISQQEIGAVKFIDFIQPDEEVPDTGPPAEGGAAAANGSESSAVGALGSAASTSG